MCALGADAGDAVADAVVAETDAQDTLPDAAGAPTDAVENVPDDAAAPDGPENTLDAATQADALEIAPDAASPADAIVPDSSVIVVDATLLDAPAPDAKAPIPDAARPDARPTDAAAQQPDAGIDAGSGSVEIQSIQDGTIPPGSNVLIRQVFVTQVAGAKHEAVTIYLQEPQNQTTAGHTYPEYSGIRVFIGATDSGQYNIPSIGDCMALTATVNEFAGETELTPITLDSDTGCGTFPTPFLIPSSLPPVTFADIASDLDPVTGGYQAGPKVETFEGVLVRVVSVQVVAETSDASGAFFRIAQQSALSGPDLFVGTRFYGSDPPLGTTFSTVTGIYTEIGSSRRLQPRDMFDLSP